MIGPQGASLKKKIIDKYNFTVYNARWQFFIHIIHHISIKMFYVKWSKHFAFQPLEIRKIGEEKIMFNVQFVFIELRFNDFIAKKWTSYLFLIVNQRFA